MKILKPLTVFCVIVFCPIFILPAHAINAGDLQKKGQSSTLESKKEAYKVGLLCPLSGPYGDIGSKQMEEIAIIEEKVNAAGGINGHPLYILGPGEIKVLPQQFRKYKSGRFQKMNRNGQLINAYFGERYREYADSLVYDTQGDEKKAVEVINHLVESNVLVILGPAFLSTTERALPIAEKGETPLVSFAVGGKIAGAQAKWVFTAKAPDAVSAVVDALKSVGPDRGKIHNYMEERLRRRADATGQNAEPKND